MIRRSFPRSVRKAVLRLPHPAEKTSSITSVTGPPGTPGPGSLWESPLLTSLTHTHLHIHPKNVQHVVTYITEQPFFPDSVNERPSDNEARPTRRTDGGKAASCRKDKITSTKTLLNLLKQKKKKKLNGRLFSLKSARICNVSLLKPEASDRFFTLKMNQLGKEIWMTPIGPVLTCL